MGYCLDIMVSNIGRCLIMSEKGEKNCWSLWFIGELKNVSGRVGVLIMGVLFVGSVVLWW